MNNQNLSILILDDSQDNAGFILRQFDGSGYNISSLRVETREEMDDAFRNKSWDVILSALQLSRFSVPDAISYLRNSGHDVPLIVVTPSISEDKAVELMRAGVLDIFLSSNLKRLITAIEREVKDARIRESRRNTEELLRQNENRMRLLFDSMREAYLIGRMIRDKQNQPVDWVYLFVNEAYKNITERKDIVGLKGSEVYPEIRQDNPELFEIFDRVTRLGGEEKYITFFKALRKWFNASCFGIGNDEFFVVYEDITELERVKKEALMSQKRIQDVLEISQKTQDSLQNMLKFSLDKVTNLFNSEYSYFFYYNEYKKEFILQAWNLAGLKDCSIINASVIYPLESTGAWGEVVRQRKPIIINDFQNNNPYKKGYPPGHVHIKRFMSVPVFNNGKIVAVAGVANKEEDYTDFEAMQLSIMLDSIWKIAEWMRIQEDLRKSEEKFATAFNSSPFAMIITTLDNYYTIEVNKAFEKITRLNRKELIGHTLEEFPDFTQLFGLNPLYNKIKKEKRFAGFEYKLAGTLKDPLYISISAETINFEGRTCALFIIEDITKRKLAEEEVKRSRERLKMYAAHLQTVREEERIILSRDLHDNLGQSLTALRMDVFRIIKNLGAGEDDKTRSLSEDAREMLSLVDSTLETVRKISRDMRPRILDELGLIPAIQWQIEEFEKYSGITCPFKSSIKNITMTPEDSIGVFRILQEAMTNISRHSRATKAGVKILKNKYNVQLIITDNGIGIKEENLKNKNSLGLLSMSERASIFGGDLEITGSNETGTKIILKIPLDKIKL